MTPCLVETCVGFARLSAGEFISLSCDKETNQGKRTRAVSACSGRGLGVPFSFAWSSAETSLRARVRVPSRLPCASRRRRGALTPRPCDDSADSTSCRVRLKGALPPCPCDARRARRGRNRSRGLRGAIDRFGDRCLGTAGVARRGSRVVRPTPRGAPGKAGLRGRSVFERPNQPSRTRQRFGFCRA